MKSSYRPAIIPIFVPHVGCPHDCVFCNQRKITGVTEEVDVNKIHNRIEMFLNSMKNKEKRSVEIAFYGGSFTAIEVDSQEAFLKVAYSFIESGDVNTIRVSTRPDAIDMEVLKRLRKYGVNTIELGVQSLDEEVLKLSERGHTIEDAKKSSKMIKEEGFKLGLQMMVGLPGDTLKKTIETANKIANLEPDFVRIYPALIIKNTAMEKMFYNGHYKPLELREAVEWTGNAYSIFGAKNIKVIRVGLQPTEELDDGTTVVAGPYHPSIRQMVDGWVYKTRLRAYLDSISGKIENVEIIVNPQMISAVIGIKKEIVDEIKNQYNLKTIKVVGNETIDLNVFYVKTDITAITSLKRF